MNKVVVIDYDMGNTDSVLRAIEKCGGNPVLSNSKSDFESATHLILPGVGAFKEGMDHLRDFGIKLMIEEEVIQKGKPFLGICLGMQLLADKGYENGEFEGLGWIGGTVQELIKTKENERIPHIGWNEINFTENNPLFETITPGKDMYFVHSYHFVCDDSKNVIATTPYCGNFISAVRKGNIFGVQFHPEKSQKNGFKVIKNFLSFA